MKFLIKSILSVLLLSTAPVSLNAQDVGPEKDPVPTPLPEGGGGKTGPEFPDPGEREDDPANPDGDSPFDDDDDWGTKHPELPPLSPMDTPDPLPGPYGPNPTPPTTPPQDIPPVERKPIR